MKGVHFI